MISLDNWMNETTRHAHVILPGLSALEQAHHDDLIWGFAVGSGAKYSAPIFPPEDARPAEWEILIRLGGLCTGQPMEEVDVEAIDDGYFDVLAAVKGLDGATVRKHYDEGGPERMLDLTLRTGPWGDRYGENPDGLTLDKVKAAPHGIDLGPMVPRLAEVLQTANGRLLRDPAVHHRRPATARRPTRATGRRPRADQPTPPALEQLVDAQRAGAREGHGPLHAAGPPRRRVPLRRGRRRDGGRELRGRHHRGADRGHRGHHAAASSRMPHGWGHDRPGTRNAVAREHAGVNTNVLSPGTFIDEISNNAAVNGIPVTLAPAPA